MGDELTATTSTETVSGTPEKPKEQPSSPTPDLSAVLARMDRLEERFAGVSPDAIADKVVKHPQFKQRTHDTIESQIKARTEELFERMSAPLEDAAAEGMDPKLVNAQRRALKEHARQIAQEELQPEPERSEERPATPAYSPEQEALDILTANGLGWADFPEWQGKSVSIQDIRAKVPKRAAEKEFARKESELKAQWMKEYEDEAKKNHDNIEHATPPPAGSPPPDNPIAKVTDSTELYKLARQQMDAGKGNK